MSAVRDSGGTLRTIKGISVRDGGGTLRTIQRAYVRDGANVARVVFSGLSASASPTSVSGAGYSPSPVQVNTTPTTVTLSGGTAPFVHAWTTLDAGWAALASSSATTAFRSPALGVGGSSIATFTDTITDANGATTTVDVSAYAANAY